MNKKEILTCINKYAAYMEEIKKRTDVVTRLVQAQKGGRTMTGYIETDIDTVYLQLRKITELIMFACVVANKSAGLALNKTLKKGYELKKIKKLLLAFNTAFFPTPKIDDGITKTGIRKIADLNNNTKSFMTEPELFTAYGKAGRYLHAQRDYQYGRGEASKTILNNAINDVNKLIALLDHHWVKISEDSSFAVVMQGNTDGKVNVSHMVQIPE